MARARRTRTGRRDEDGEEGGGRGGGTRTGRRDDDRHRRRSSRCWGSRQSCRVSLCVSVCLSRLT
jgi:hypothetical protein